MAKKPKPDPEMEALAEASRRWHAETPIEVQVAIRRKQMLAHCLKHRYWLKHGNDYATPEAVRLFLKHAQRSLLNLRRYRATGVWPTEN